MQIVVVFATLFLLLLIQACGAMEMGGAAAREVGEQLAKRQESEAAQRQQHPHPQDSPRLLEQPTTVSQQNVEQSVEPEDEERAECAGFECIPTGECSTFLRTAAACIRQVYCVKPVQVGN